ncbi:MAG: hypothetical protein [Arizlama microvirus]|nr:MAG: hypothetical protein [Arizlama microvirus]
MRRMKVNKNRSARNFRKSTMKTRRINIAPGFMRGGIRL